MKRFFTLSLILLSLSVFCQAPVNDDAPGAIVLSVGGTCPSTLYSSDNATRSANEKLPECSGAGWSAPVWFKFVATAGAVKITSDYALPGSGGTPIGEIALFSATNVNDYSTFTILACDFESGAVNNQVSSTLYATGLTVGQTYYIECDTYIGYATGFCVTVENLGSNLLSTTNTCSSGYQKSLILPTSGFYYGQSSLADDAGKLVAIIQRTQSGTLNGNTSTGQNIYNGPGIRQDGAGNYYLDRNFRFSNTSNPTNIKVQLFFLNTEIAELTAIDPSITLNTLGITRQTGDICTNDFGVGGANSPLTVTGTGSQNGVSWVEFITPGFSNFMVHKAGIILPVDIEYFKGATVKAGNLLTWKMNCNNISSARIIIERGADGTHFTTIKELTESTSRCLHPFEFIDSFPLAGHNFYRLKMGESNGSFKYSNIVQLKNTINDFEIISIYPTPVISSANAEIRSLKPFPALIDISSSEGNQLIKTSRLLKAGTNKINFETQKLLPGYYVLSITNEKGNKQSIGFIKL